MKIIDSFLFFNELDLLEIRLKYLYPVVDYFIITEAKKSFGGYEKKLYFEENKKRFLKYKNKIVHQIIDYIPERFDNFNKPDPRYTDYHKSYDHKHFGKKLIDLNMQFQREVYLKDYQIIGISKVAEMNDYIILGDLDEIPDTDILKQIKANQLIPENEHITLCLKWYMYYFNLRFPKEWFGIRMCRYQYLEDKSVDLLRYPLEVRTLQKFRIFDNAGWHFSFFGGEAVVKEKLYKSNFSGRRFNFLLKILNYIFPSRLKKKLNTNSDVLEMNRKFQEVNPVLEFPNDLLKIISNYKFMFK
jgi:beta-1,4-mannosyl-glycoprotein beta-1,4-N-acetylglucosaminyltransferase